MINTMKLSAVCLLLYITQVDFSQVSAMCFSPTAFKLSNKCFEVFDTPMTWLEAEKTCFTFTERRSLAKVSTMNELSFLDFLKPNGHKEMWLGANDPTHDGKWVWQDGTIANLSSLWSPNEPNNVDGDEYCLEIFRDGKLNDESCDRLRPFVCMELTAKRKCDKTTEKICDDGYCIPNSFWCDGDKDCKDGSDESNCSSTHAECRHDEFHCSSPAHEAQCIKLYWLCDGEMDCKDGSDEVNCTKRDCPPNHKLCDINLCITSDFFCDGEFDCKDKSDEANCNVTKTTATPKTYPKTYPTTTATLSFTTARNESKPNNVSSDSLAACISKTATKFDNNCYELFTTPRNWTEAQKYCSNFIGERSLAKVSSLSVLRFLFSLRPSNIRVWLGGNDQLQEGEWMWTDGTKANLTSLWHVNEPNNIEGNEDCLELYEHGMLNDDNCANSLSFICMELHEKTGNPEMSPSTTKTLPLTINTTLLPNTTTTLTTETTPSTTPTTAAIEIKNNNNVSNTGNVSNNTLELNSSRPTVIIAENANDKFEQSQKVAFTVGLSKPLDFLLKDVVVYNKVVSNVGDDYNNSTGVFRCNVAGLYFFQIYGAANKGKELSLSLVKNKTKVVSLYSNTNQELSLAANSAVLLLEAGDEVFVEASNCGSLYGEEHHVINTFSGFLLKKAI